MSEQAYALIVAEMPEVEQLALLSVCDSGPVSDALLAKLFKRRLIKSVRVGTTLSPRIERRPTPLGQDVADYLRAHGPKQDDGTGAK